MIRYTNKDHVRCSFLRSTWILKLKAFQKSSFIGAANMVFGIILKSTMTQLAYGLPTFDDSAYTSFTWFLGILVVFRTAQSLSRFWEGSTLIHKMMGHWCDASVSVTAFCKAASASDEETSLFQMTFVRLISLLNAMILADLEGTEHDEGPSLAFGYELLDAKSLDRQSINIMKRTDAKALLVYQWINNLMVKGQMTGILDIPAPLLARAFQALNLGLLDYMDALKFVDTPFPFPYAASIEILLTLHFGLTPLAVCAWTDNLGFVALFCFILVSSVWVLHLVASELENPFGHDMNALEMEEMQKDMNRNLTRLVSAEFQHTPGMRTVADHEEFLNRLRSSVRTTRLSTVKSFHGIMRTATDSLANEAELSRTSTIASSVAEEDDEIALDDDEDECSFSNALTVLPRARFSVSNGKDVVVEVGGQCGSVVEADLEDRFDATDWSDQPLSVHMPADEGILRGALRHDRQINI